MSELVFHSCFASDLEAFIRHKQSLGYLLFGTGIFSQRRSREFRQLESTEFS